MSYTDGDVLDLFRPEWVFTLRGKNPLSGKMEEQKYVAVQLTVYDRDAYLIKVRAAMDTETITSSGLASIIKDQAAFTASQLYLLEKGVKRIDANGQRLDVKTEDVAAWPDATRNKVGQWIKENSDLAIKKVPEGTADPEAPTNPSPATT